MSTLEMNCFTSWLKEWAILHAYCICWRKALFCLKARKTRCIFKSFAVETSCFKALRTRHILCMLHLSEVRFTKRPVIPMDMNGLRWIPMDPIGFHSTNRYRWIPSDNISALYDFHLTSGTLSRQSYLTSAGLGKNMF